MQRPDVRLLLLLVKTPLNPLCPLSDPHAVHETRLRFSHAAPHCIFQCISLPASPVSHNSLSPPPPPPSACLYPDRKTPQVFLVGNSWRGMLPCEQGVRVESRFSGSSLTPCSAIASQPRCHGQCRVRTRRRLLPVPAQPDPWWFLAVYSAMCVFRFSLAVFVCFFFSSSLSLCVHHLTSRCDFEIVSHLS